MTEPLPSRKFPLAALAALAALPALAVSIHPGALAASSAETSDRTAFVLLSPGTRNTTMSGSMEDMRRARSLRNGEEGLLYVRRSGVSYVIRDSQTLRRAQAIFEPQQALGTLQAELGSRQAALGREQAQLGARQARLGHHQANASPSRSRELERQQDELGRLQDALGRRQDVLGREQDALGRRQDALSRQADSKIHALLDEAIRSGVARRVD